MMSPANATDDTSQGHGAFLHRAAHDPLFRTALETDPQAALAEYGLSVDPEQIPSQVTLPETASLLNLVSTEDSSDPNDPDDIDRIPWVWLIAG